MSTILTQYDNIFCEWVVQYLNLCNDCGQYLNDNIVNFILTKMKQQTIQLSQFQQQQYTQYLESQLEKFSAFMLSQKKQNQQVNQHQSILSHHASLIEQLQKQMEISKLQQEEQRRNMERQEKKQQLVKDLEVRMIRLEDRDRFQCNKHSYLIQDKGENKEDKQNKQVMKKLGQRLKMVEDTLLKMQDSPMQNQPELFQAIEEQTTHKAKKLEKKMKKYFGTKLETIQELLLKPKKTKKTKSKSPSARTPIEMSTMSRYEVSQSIAEPALSQFRLQDMSNKHELSTILRDSHNSTFMSQKPKKNVRKGDNKENKETNNRSKSKSKSRSKSQKKAKGKEQDKKKRKHGKSRNRSVSKSVTISDNSFLRSSCSHSRSPSIISQVHHKMNTSRPKVKTGKKSRLSVSKSKSNHSGISLHQKCKMKPYLETNPKKDSKKSKDKAKRK